LPGGTSVVVTTLHFESLSDTRGRRTLLNRDHVRATCASRGRGEKNGGVG